MLKVRFCTFPPMRHRACENVKVKVSQSCPTLWPHGLYSPWNSSGKNTGVVSRSPLQGIFPTQGSHPDFPHCRRFLYQLSHKGSPRILEWVAYPFSSGSSLPRNQTQVSRIAGGFFTSWATREAQYADKDFIKNTRLAPLPGWVLYCTECEGVGGRGSAWHSELRAQVAEAG